MESLTDQLLPIAREVLRNEKVRETRSGEQGIWYKSSILEVYERDIAALPITIDQAGLRTAIAIYSSTPEKSEGNRKLILQLLLDILNEAKLVNQKDCDSFIDTILDDKDGSITLQYEEFIIQAAIALKRAIRTFPVTKN